MLLDSVSHVSQQLLIAIHSVDDPTYKYGSVPTSSCCHLCVLCEW